jgi:hypothetical protein
MYDDRNLNHLFTTNILASFIALLISFLKKSVIHKRVKRTFPMCNLYLQRDAQPLFIYTYMLWLVVAKALA